MKQVFSLSFLTVVLCICTHMHAADTATKLLMQNSFMQVSASSMGNAGLTPGMRMVAQCLAQSNEPKINPAFNAMKRLGNGVWSGCKWTSNKAFSYMPWMLLFWKSYSAEIIAGACLAGMGGLWAHQKYMSRQMSDLSETVEQQGEANKLAFAQADRQRAAMITHLINTHGLLIEVQGKTNHIDGTTTELLGQFTQLREEVTQLREEVATKTDLRQLEQRVFGFQFAVYQQLQGQIKTLTNQQKKHIDEWQEQYGRLHAVTQAHAEAIAGLRHLVQQVKDAQDQDRITNESTNAMVSTLLANQTAGQSIAASSYHNGEGSGPTPQVYSLRSGDQNHFFSLPMHANVGSFNNGGSQRLLLTNQADGH